MLPGPDTVYQCPNCENLFTRGSLASWNTLKVTLYSDQSHNAPQKKRFPSVTICSKCDTIFYISDAKKIGVFRRWLCHLPEGYFENLTQEDKHNRAVWMDLEPARFLSIYENFRRLNEKIYNGNLSEFHIRVNILHEFNNRVRGVIVTTLFEKPEDESLWLSNIHRLLELCDIVMEERRLEIEEFRKTDKYGSIFVPNGYWKRPHMCMLKAELFRYLGQFDKCMSCFNDLDFSEDFRENEEEPKKFYDSMRQKFQAECDAKNTAVFQLSGRCS